MIEADLVTLEPSRFREILDDGQWARFDGALERARAALSGRTLWHVNSTITGGGVAELLASVAGYLIGSGIRTRWMAIEGNDDFFVVTKRIHHLLHGKPGDGGELGRAEAEIYESVLAKECEALAAEVRDGDVVVLHDPQAAGLAPAMRDLGARVIWNCHIGADEANAATRLAWQFLLPSVTKSDAQVFSRRQYVWEGLGQDQIEIIAPCIDAFSPKNQELTRDQVESILAATGIVHLMSGGEAGFVRPDGSAGRVRSKTHMIESAPVPPGVPIVTQVSRWDPLKDHSGLALGFAMGVPSDLGAHLILAGPDPEAVADDPEGQATLEDLRSCVESLPDQARDRTHIACLPMGDNDENAAIVNALQHYSTIVVQKSLAEGFGLTVAEAMWKARPTVASAVGGIQDQIVDDESGILIDDPEDIEAFAHVISGLLVDEPAARRLGAGARRAVVEHHLAPSYIRHYLDLAERVLED